MGGMSTNQTLKGDELALAKSGLEPKRPSAALTLTAGLLGFALVCLDASIVNVALPAIGSSLGGGMSGLQWVVDAYTLAFAALMLSTGAFSDRAGASGRTSSVPPCSRSPRRPALTPTRRPWSAPNSPA